MNLKLYNGMSGVSNLARLFLLPRNSMPLSCVENDPWRKQYTTKRVELYRGKPMFVLYNEKM